MMAKTQQFDASSLLCNWMLSYWQSPRSQASYSLLELRSRSYREPAHLSREPTGGRHKKTFLRLPSQWKSKVLPTFLKNAGCTEQNYGQFLLQVLRSIYGETYAPKRWQETLARVLKEMGYVESQLEEGLYFRTQNGKLSVVSTYVDDLWFFDMDPDSLVSTMFEVSRKLRCTAGEILCGAPGWLWDPVSGAKSPTVLSDYQKSMKEFFKPLEGPERFGVATKKDPLSYVSMSIYFSGDMLVIDQTSYMDKAFKKLQEKASFPSLIFSQYQHCVQNFSIILGCMKIAKVTRF